MKNFQTILRFSLETQQSYATITSTERQGGKGRKMITRLKFKSNATGGVRYVEFNDAEKTYSVDYYAANGGHKPSQNVRLKDVRAARKRCEELEYKQVSRC